MPRTPTKERSAPKGPPPRPAKTSAFKSSTGLKPPPKPASTKGLKDPLTAPYKTTAGEDAGVREIRRRQDTKTKGIIQRRVSAQHGLLPVSATPFGNNHGADPYQVDLTAKTDLAKANHARLEQGGVLTPKQAAREKTAAEIVTGNVDQRTFRESHDLGALARIATPPSPPPAHPHAMRHLTSEPAPPRRAQPAYGARGGVPGNPQVAPVTPGLSVGQMLSKAADVVDRGVGAAGSEALAFPGTLLTPPSIRSGSSTGELGAPSTPIEKVKANTSLELASKIGHLGLKTPNISIPSIELDPASQAALRPGVKALPADQLGAAGFNPETTVKYRTMALKRGWYKLEIDQLNGLDLLEHAYNDPPFVLLRAAQNFATGAAQTGAAGTALVGLGREVAGGHTERALGQLGGIAGGYFGMLLHPKEAAISRPFDFVPATGVAGKTAGLAGFLRGAEHMGLRDVRTGVPAAVRVMGEHEIGPQEPGFTGSINRGVYSRNLWTQAGERASDKLAEVFGQRHLFAQHVDRIVRRSANRHGAEHQVAQLAYKKAQRAVGKKRAELLLALQHAGGKPEEIAQLYEKLAEVHPKGEKSPAAGAARFNREKVIPIAHALTEKDENFLAAHELLSEHTSDTLIGLGRFSRTAKIYRQHEPLILAAAHRADKSMQDHGLDEATALHMDDLPEETRQALHILALRKDLELDVPSDAPKGVRWDTRRGKIAEADRGAGRAWKDHQAHVKIMNSRPKPPERINDANAARAKYAPGAYAAFRKDMRTWRAKERAARSKAQQSGKTFNDQERRGTTLGAAELEQARVIPDKADIRAQYEDAVAAFAAHHQASGGMQPARVAYTKAETSPLAKFRGGGGRGFVPKIPGRQAPSTGRSFLSGNYLIDSRSPILENLRAQRLQQSIGAYHSVMSELGRKVGPNVEIPPDMVFVRGSSLTSLGAIEHELESNPVSHGEHFSDEHSIRQTLHDTLKGATQAGNFTKEEGVLLPRGAFHRMLDYARPEDQSAYNTFLRQYQRSLISLFPGTIIGNTFGTAPLAFASGAGYRSFRDAKRAMQDPTLAPSTLFGRGVAGGLASEAHHVATQYMDFMRRQSVKGEDLGRLAGYFSKAGPHIRAEAERLGVSADAYARAFAKGQVDPQLLDHFLDHAEKFLGDTVKPNTAIGRQIGKVILFQNWVGHIAKVLLYTLPIKHPRRASMLNILGEYGTQYAQDHGVWPAWMTDYAPVGGFDRLVPGQPPALNHFTRAINLGQLMPQSTAGGLIDNLMQDQPLLERAQVVAGPPWSELLAVGIQQIKNSASDSESNHAVVWRTAVNQLLGAIPGFRKLYPMAGRKPDDLSIFGEPSYKMYSSNAPGRPLNPFLSPYPQPDRGLGGFLERSLGFGAYTVPNQGRIADIQTSKVSRALPANERSTTQRNRTEKRKHDLYQRMLAAGWPEAEAKRQSEKAVAP